ncbi:MAG: T9SS type A sorting domain-containing protein [Bacteroidota bacterium]
MKFGYLFFFALICHCSFFGQLPPKDSYPLEVKQIHSGHSLTDPLFGQPWPGQFVNLISELRGEWAGDDIGKSTIPGSPIFWRWDHDHDNYGAPSARFDIDDWELLIITEGIPIPNDGGNPPAITPANEYLSLYVNNSWNNGNMANGAATLLWTTWTNLDGAERPWRQTLDDYELLWEEMMDYANDNRPNGAPHVYIIPGHRMMARLYDDIQLNLVPGISTIDQFFSDNIHTNSLGDYAIAMIHYACIFNQSPVGLPNDLMPNPPDGFQIPSPELAFYLQDMIWDVVTTYDRTGISESSLPVIWGDFTARKAEVENAVLLNWGTFSEINNRGFEIENSVNGRDWATIDFIRGKGNSSQFQSYGYIHNAPNNGINYYRLKQIDFDGNFNYSPITSIDLGKNNSSNFNVFPNPAENVVYIRAQEPSEVSIYSIDGSLIHKEHLTEELSLDVSQLHAGVYYIRIGTEFKKLIIR